MKNNRFLTGLLLALFSIAALLAAVIFYRGQYRAFMVMNSQGYLISLNDITRNLLDDGVIPENADVGAVPFSVSDIIYEKAGDFFIGQNKIPVNASYPLFINEASAIMSLTGDAGMISDDFDFVQGYSGLYVSDGISFNPDMERAYREEFILVSLSNGFYVNTKEIIAADNFFIKENIPVNSIIRFLEKEIRYYRLQDGRYVFSSVKPVGKSTVITVNGRDYLYYDFLEKLGIYRKDGIKSPPEDKREVNTPERLLIPLELKKKEPVKNVGTQSAESEPEAPAQAPGTWRSEPAEEAPVRTADPGRTLPSNQPIEPALPAEPASPADPPPPVPPAGQPASGSEADTGSPDDSPVVNPPDASQWKKPSVKLGDFSTSVYSIMSKGLKIENPEFLYRSGVRFEVYEGEKLVMVRAYTESSDVFIAPLKPDQEYLVKVSMAYLDARGNKQNEKLSEAAVRTKPLSELPKLVINWQNGNIFYSRIQLKNLQILNAVKEAVPAVDSDGKTVMKDIYIETVQYLNCVDVAITGKKDSQAVYTFPLSGGELGDLRTGKAVQYETTGRIHSDTEYEYEFHFYDRFGNELPVDGTVRGGTRTCKKPPEAEITLLKNEVKDIEAGILIGNTDEAEIVGDSIYFVIYDRDDNPVKTTIARKTGEGGYLAETEALEAHSVKITGENIKLLDLLDYEIYKIRVFCDYDINDDLGLYEYAAIGELKFTTMPVSALGYAFFDIELSDVDDRSAKITLRLNKNRTDGRLTALISDMDVAVRNKETSEGTGILLAYEMEGGEPDGGEQEGAPGDSPANNGFVTLKADEIERMKANENDGVTFYVKNLKSITEYDIRVMPKVALGNLNNKAVRDVEAAYMPGSFTTMKQSPVIDIDVIYASSDFIKLYGLSVNDPDGAVVAYPVTISLFDGQDRQIASYELSSADKAPVISFDRLEKDVVYTIRFSAAEYNNGFDMTTYRKGFELYYSRLFEKREYLRVATRDAVSGSIQLLQLNRNRIISQTEILATKTDNKITSHNNKIRMEKDYRFSSSNQPRAKFSAAVDFGIEAVNSFQIGYSYGGRTTNYTLYLEDPDVNPYAEPIAAFSADQKTLGTEYCRWTDIQLFDNDLKLKGRRTVYIVANTYDSKGGIHYLWGIRFLNIERSGGQHYFADLNAIVNDSGAELGSVPSYKIKVYRDDVWVDTRRHEWIKNEDGAYSLRMYQVAPDGSEVFTSSKVFAGADHYCNTDFYYKIGKGWYTYRFELWVNVYGYEICLDREEFSSEKEVTGIRTQEDLNNIRFGLSNKYFVLNDIEMSLGTGNITAGQTFNGELDFRGCKLTYGYGGELITRIGYGGALKNMVFAYADDWGRDRERQTNYIINVNYGKIQNVMITRNNGNADESYKSLCSALCATNESSGIIENFAVNLKDPLTATSNIAGVCVTNRGMIRNGYVYGNIKRTDSSRLDILKNSERMIIGGVVRYNETEGIVENVYSLVNIETRGVLSSSDYANTIIGLNLGRLENSFSCGDVSFGGEIRKNVGPAYQSSYAGTVANAYFYSALDYGNTNNAKISKQILRDAEWYGRMFNSSGSSRKGQFVLEPVKLGYYPHVAWPDFMPQQEYVPLPALLEEDQVKIIDTDVKEQGINYAMAVLTFHNPEDFKITEIKMNWLNVEIISQDRIKDFYRVTVRLTQAPETKYYSEYKISSFTYSLGFQGLTQVVEYTDNDAPVVRAEFYKPVASVEEWAVIKDDPAQNYRLEADLDFQHRAPSVAVIPANVELAASDSRFKLDAFSGKLDGNGHKLKFIDTGDYGYVIGKLSGSVKDLTVENITAVGKGRYKGFIGRMLENSGVDNVHVIGMEAVSVQHCGAIAGDARSAAVINSSAHNIKIRTVEDGVYTQYVGGLIGKQRVDYESSLLSYISIMNCYADRVDIEVLEAGDCGGAGGIVGYIRAGSEIYHAYIINSSISTAFKNAGGIIGAVDGRTGDALSYMLKDYYADVDITSVTESIGGVIGFAGLSNAEAETNGLVLGNTSTSKQNPGDVGFFFGYGKYAPDDIYRYENALLNGLLNMDTADTTILTYEALCDPATYGRDGPLAWDGDFVPDPAGLAEGIMPKLRDTTHQELLPYQEDYRLEKNPVEVTSIQSVKYQSGELYVVQIVTEHAPGVTVTGALFDGLLPAELADPSEAVVITRNEKGTVLEYVLGIEGYYNAYYLSGLNYTTGPDSGSRTLPLHISVGISPQYLTISSAEEWNAKMSPEAFGKKNYNVRITGNLDFSALGGNAASNVALDNLMGDDRSEWMTISGIRLSGNESFIKSAAGSISYLKFEDITLTKAKASHPGAIATLGLISSVTDGIHDASFSSISINSFNSSYVGLAALSYGRNYNISLSGITVSSQFDSEPASRATGGLIGKLSGTGGVYDVSAKNLIVAGRTFTGGIVGTQWDGRHIFGIDIENEVVTGFYQNSSSSYVGGVVGYAPSAYFANRVGGISVRRAVVAGASYVGGASGYGCAYGDTTMSNNQRDSYSTDVNQAFIVGTGTYVGGVAGRGVAMRANVSGSYVYGLARVGGITGNGDVFFGSCADSVIGTVYDRDSADTGNVRFSNTVEERREYYNGMLAVSTDHREKAVYEKAAEVLGYLVTPARKSAWSTKSFGSNNQFAGGISAWSMMCYNSVVSNCRIGSFGATSVGGLIGYGSQNSYNSSVTRQYVSSGTQNCDIYGAQNVGGLIGTYYSCNMESCYSNSRVTASSANAGGIAGYVKATSVWYANYTPYINRVYFAGSVTAPDYAAGIAGRMDQYLFATNSGWLMAGDVTVTNAGGHADLMYNRALGDPGGITGSMVYEGSTITAGNNSMNAADYYGRYPVLLLENEISLATTPQLSQTSTYTGGMGYGSGYWNYNGLANGYMPYTTHSPYNNYNTPTAMRILHYQEGYMPDPDNAGKARVDENGNYVYRYETYNGGIPIPGSGAGVVPRAQAKKSGASGALPAPQFYAVDADKLNIEFTDIQPKACFKIFAGGQPVAEKQIAERTFTLNYDFRTELEITVTDGVNEARYSVFPEDVCRNIMTFNADYYYITSKGIAGSGSMLYGAFANLYAGRALDAKGDVYDAESGQKLRAFEGIGLSDSLLPLYTFKYDGYNINTYKNYSAVDSVNRSRLRLYVKNNRLSAISAKLPVIPDSIILDEYNGNEYCAVLSSYGSIEDMTSCPVKLPEDFDNSGIQYMTSNLFSTGHILLVRYYDGAVAGLNYITGEKLDIDSPRGTAAQMQVQGGFKGRSKNASMANFDSEYLQAVEFETSFIDSGWAEVNGSNVKSGNNVSGDDGRIGTDAPPALSLAEAGTAENRTDSGIKAGDGRAQEGKAANEGTAAADAVDGAPGSAGGGKTTDGASSGSLPAELPRESSAEAPSNKDIPQDGKNTGAPEPTEDTEKAEERGSSDGASASETGAAAGPAAETGTSGRTAAADGVKGEEASGEKPSSAMSKYILVYDSDASKYVMYDEHELLSAGDGELETINKKVERSGHIIEYRAKQRADINNPGDNRLYGYLLLSFAITGIGLLLSYLILKKNKETAI